MKEGESLDSCEYGVSQKKLLLRIKAVVTPATAVARQKRPADPAADQREAAASEGEQRWH